MKFEHIVVGKMELYGTKFQNAHALAMQFYSRQKKLKMTIGIVNQLPKLLYFMPITRSIKNSKMTI